MANGTRSSQQRLESKALISKGQSKLVVSKHKQKVDIQRIRTVQKGKTRIMVLNRKQKKVKVSTVVLKPRKNWTNVAMESSPLGEIVKALSLLQQTQHQALLDVQ